MLRQQYSHGNGSPAIKVAYRIFFIVLSLKHIYCLKMFISLVYIPATLYLTSLLPNLFKLSLVISISIHSIVSFYVHIYNKDL